MFKIYFTVKGIDKKFTFTGKNNKPVTVESEDEAKYIFRSEESVMKEIQCYSNVCGEIILHKDEINTGYVTSLYFDTQSKHYPLTGRLKTVLRQLGIVELE